MNLNTLMLCLILALIAAAAPAFKNHEKETTYRDCYIERIQLLHNELQSLLTCVDTVSAIGQSEKKFIAMRIRRGRMALKSADIWLRYLGPVHYKKLNGPLPVEWETEVFEKYEAPYRREGGGLYLAYNYLQENDASPDSLRQLIVSAIEASRYFLKDSLTALVQQPGHFPFCNRLFLLNLSAIYTSGYECPDPDFILPELRQMLSETKKIYQAFNRDFPELALSSDYMDLFTSAELFVNRQTDQYKDFDHYYFIRHFVNPLFSLNQQLIRRHQLSSRNENDYSLNSGCVSIFSKNLYRAQNSKGIFHRVNGKEDLAELRETGRKLFYDPILSGNNLRSCASCHQPELCFSDTSPGNSMQFNGNDRLPRNTPSLANAVLNHLLMQDGKHYNLQNQATAVIGNKLEMACEEKEMLSKILSCSDYKRSFSKLLKHTPEEPHLTSTHVSSAITYFYGTFSEGLSEFDDAMNGKAELSPDVIQGFNLFMGKAQCGTCHFVPLFNGVKPPYIGSEFEVLGIPADSAATKLSPDPGRYAVHQVPEMKNAFRTGTLRNISKTWPYMHNGVFRTLDQVLDFYDAGGGAGLGLPVENQTLSSDSLRLSKNEKKQLVAFMKSLDERIDISPPPQTLPPARNRSLNLRKIGGVY